MWNCDERVFFTKVRIVRSGGGIVPSGSVTGNVGGVLWGGEREDMGMAGGELAGAFWLSESEG